MNTDTGQVVMNRIVAEGWLSGAGVHEQGQLVDHPATPRVRGGVQLMPASA